MSLSHKPLYGFVLPNTGERRKKLLEAYAEELLVKRLEWANVLEFWQIWLRGQDLNLRPSGYGELCER